MLRRDHRMFRCISRGLFSQISIGASSTTARILIIFFKVCTLHLHDTGPNHIYDKEETARHPPMGCSSRSPKTVRSATSVATLVCVCSDSTCHPSQISVTACNIYQISACRPGKKKQYINHCICFARMLKSKRIFANSFGRPHSATGLMLEANFEETLSFST